MANPSFPPEGRRGSARRITVVGEDVLARPCRDVTEFGTTELSTLIDDMFTTMYVAEGVGLAANQVDVDLRLFVYDCTDENGERHVGHVVNPVLEELPAEERNLVEASEGCLSVPGPHTELARPDRAVVHGQDKDGTQITVTGTGYFARCLQHETDHTLGQLYLDRVPKRLRKRLLREMSEQQDAVFERRAELTAALQPSSD